MKRVSNILLYIFAAGVLLSVFAGALSFVVYVIALIIGGDMATEICFFTFKSYLPWVIKFTSFFVWLGLLGMYLSKMKALAMNDEKDV